MLKEQITQPIWVSVKTETRQKLREVLLIPKTGQTDVINDEMGGSRVISDGCTNENLKAITAEKLQEFIGSVPANATLHELFKMAVDKIEAPLPVEVKDPKLERIKELKERMDTYHAAMLKVGQELDALVAEKIVDGKVKCEQCEFQTASPIAMKMHVGRKHKKVKTL